MLDRFLNWINTSATFKLFTILLISLILLIPMSNIKPIVYERQNLKTGVIDEISSKWGKSQLFYGPILSIPYIEESIDDDGKVKQKVLYVLPDSLDMECRVDPEVRYLGIYKATLYEAKTAFSGSLELPNLEQLGMDSSQFDFSKATLSFFISDPGGISDDIELSINGTKTKVSPGQPSLFPISAGFHSKIDVSEFKSLAFKGKVQMKGTEQLKFVPLGRKTELKLSSQWKDPKFSGRFLPAEREINDSGFEASYKILDFNRSFPQVWEDHFYSLNEWTFGVDLIDPVNIYQKTLRALKYAFLFIALTFTLFFFFEVLKRFRIHPIQYLIVGIAIAIFYTLLLALSEHLSFETAYLSAASAIVLICSTYFYFITKSAKAALSFFVMFSALYIFIFTILSATDYALLIGSLGLLAVITAIMYFTRNVNWYAMGKGQNERPGIEGSD